MNSGAHRAAIISKGKGKQFELPAVLERFESKYTIPFSMIDPISSFIAPYCSLDKYSQKEPGLFYRINSLYFDTPGYLFLRQRLLKAEKRFNMRIRSYGDQQQLPFYFEIKQRRGEVVRKFRARVNTADIQRLLDEPTSHRFDGEDDKQFENRQLFSRTAHRYNAGPVVLVRYRRKAYVSDYDDYARVTFDCGLQYAPQSDYSPVPGDEERTFRDARDCFDSGNEVVLELKCYTSSVPVWMVDLVRAFQLKRRGFSKYAQCVLPLVSSYLAQGAFTRESVLSDSYFEED